MIYGYLRVSSDEQVYDTILCDAEFNPLYRQHGQKKVRKKKY